MQRLHYCLVLLIGLIVFPAQAQDSEYAYKLALERIEEARQTHAETVRLPDDLVELPPELFALTDLKMLSLNYIHLARIPPEIGNLTNLRTLRICCIGLQSLPPEIGNLTNLEDLGLASNGLTTLPDEISQLKNLKMLQLSGNGIKTLPASIGELTSLEELWLDYNQLTTLPPEIGQLTNLTILNLGGNRLTSLPAEIEHLTNLCWMDANSNLLQEIPSGIARLNSLTKGEGCTSRNGGYIYEGLALWGNPLPYPQEVINGDTKTIFAYLDNLAAFYMPRMLLVAGGVGSLIILLVAGAVWQVRTHREKKKKRG